MDRSDPKRLSPVQPFVLTRLSDVVPQSVLRSLQTGIATEHRIGLALVEPDNGGFHYLPPSHAGTAGCRFCSILRGVDEGRALCEACDFSIARRVMEQGPGSGPQWVECHMGLCGLAMPIVVADRVAAVFLSGQKVWPGSRDSVRAQARRVGDQIADLDHEALIAAVDGLDECTEQERARIEAIVAQHAEEIGKLGRDRYDVERRLRQEYLLNELMIALAGACTDVQELRYRLEGVTERVIDFFRLQYMVVYTQTFGSSPELAPAAWAGDWPGSRVSRMRCPVRPRRAGEDSFYRIVAEPAGVARFLAEHAPDASQQFPGAQALICDYGVPEERVTVTVFGPQRPGHTESLLSTAGDDFLERFHFEVGMRSKAARLLLDLRQANEDKTQFMAQLTHEINAGLQTVVEESEWLQYYVTDIAGLDDPDLLEPLDKILSEVLRLGSRARASLMHLRGGMPRGEYRLRERHPLHRLVSVCVEPYRGVAQSRNITIQVDASVHRLPPVPFDWEMMKLAVMNLIDNAVKYSHFNRTIRIYAEADESSVSLAVEDYGLGIPPEEHERIFEPYVRGSRRDPRRFIWGSGLGLAVARDVVETHGGTIGVTSVPTAKSPVGDEAHRWENYITTFTIRLPLRQEEH